MMKSVWNSAIETSLKIERARIPFGTQRLSDSFNCRSATIALLHSISLSYYSPVEVETDCGVMTDLLTRVNGGHDPQILPDHPSTSYNFISN